MTIEEEIFQKSIILDDKLREYGFQKQGEVYLYVKNILDNSFQVEIAISKLGVKGKIYDLAFKEEYTNYRITNSKGAFVNKIREEFQNILIDIRNNCTKSKYFLTDMANDLANLIIKNYHDEPNFLWEKFPGFAVFKNSFNDKWYALIMNINKKKLGEEDLEVEVLNVKLRKEKIKELLKRKGFYEAYHMNKENWITIILDGTIPLEEIMEYIKESYEYTLEVKEWLIPANFKYYNVIEHFQKEDTILWKQSGDIKVGDLVYLYVSKPYSSILYKLKVLDVNIPYSFKDKNIKMSKVMKLKLLTRFKEDEYTV